MLATETLYPEVEKYSWMLLSAVQLLPCFTNVPIGVQLLLNSTLVVLLGVIKSVDIAKTPSKDVDGQTEVKRAEATTEGEKEETIKTKDALMFPITASCSLLVLYLLFKFVSKTVVQVLLKVYFSYLGMYALGLYLAEKLIEKDKSLDRITFEKDLGFKIPYVTDEPLKIVMRKADNFGFAISFAIAAAYCLTSNWLLNNVFGITFSIAGIRLLKLSDIKIGFIMLWGLFIYDIFWVFKTDVMVTVAKSVDGPILLKFPVNLAEGKFSMLGLGDMIIPGAFISLLLKFDVDKYCEAFPRARVADIKTPFMWYNVIFYFIGISVTYAFMVIFEHAQPALLYLVPAASIGFAIPALQRGKLADIFAYKAHTDEDEKAAEQKTQ